MLPETMEEIASEVEVALVVVELRAVKFCKVLDELTRRLANVPRPVEVKLPPLAVVKKRLVVDAVVEKRLVEVADDEVELTRVTFWKVEEALAKRLLVVARPVTVAELTVRRPLALIERAEAEEVAKVEALEVAM
jgi:hypothetical protein